MSYPFKILLIFMTMIIESIIFAFCMATKQKEKESLYRYVFIHGVVLIVVGIFFIGYLIFSLFL